jgi:hypothetical protein
MEAMGVPTGALPSPALAGEGGTRSVTDEGGEVSVLFQEDEQVPNALTRLASPATLSRQRGRGARVDRIAQ